MDVVYYEIDESVELIYIVVIKNGVSEFEGDIILL